MDSEAASRQAGVQSLERATAILRALASTGSSGTRLADITEAIGLGKTTTHRLLNTLLELGYAQQDPVTKRYRLGIEIYALAMAARSQLDIIELAQPSLKALADMTGDTVFLSVIDRYEAVCVGRQVGTFPIRTLTLNIGDRRPLGIGSGSLALLAALPADERRKAMELTDQRLPAFSGFDISKIHRLVEETNARGYAFNDGFIVAGMSAMAMAIRDADNRPVAALSVAAIAERMKPERRDEIAALLKNEVNKIGELLDPAKATREAA